MKYIVLLFIFIASSNSWSQASMKRCTLLPVTDGVGGAIANPVFIEVEKRIKAGQYCSYVSNADLLHVFSRYRNNLANHLKSPEVIKVVGDKLNVGSLIRINIVNEINGVEVEMEVHGANGTDSYFQEKKSLSSDDVEEIVIQVTRWISEYNKNVPYDALVLGVLGEQVTIDLPKDLNVRPGQEFIVKKLHQKKQHPLLKKIVEWDSEVIAQGVIKSLSDDQALGEINHYRNNGRINSGDWIKVLPYREPKVKLPEEKRIEPGKLGQLSAAFTLDSLSTKNKTPTSSNSLSGMSAGVDLTAEAWITRMYFAKVNYARSLGSVKRNSGDVDNRLDINQSQVKVLGGYKFLPLGFFYGPQIDFYGGYASFTYDSEDASTHGYSEHRFSGFLVGVLGNIPINNIYRFYAGFEMMGFPNFEDSSDNYGSKKSISSFELDLGVKYQYNPRITFDAGLAISSRKATFSGDYKEIHYRNNKLKLGATFTF